MTTFEKAMIGDCRAIERYFFTKDGATRSDEESDIINNMELDYRERLLRIQALRERQPSMGSKSKPSPAHVAFGLLIGAGDAIHARALGVRLD